MDTKIDIIELGPGILFEFIYVPKGYIMKSNKLSGHKVRYVGKLNSFNRLAVLKGLQAKAPNDLVEYFTALLTKRGWDFSKFPNPSAYACTVSAKG